MSHGIRLRASANLEGVNIEVQVEDSAGVMRIENITAENEYKVQEETSKIIDTVLHLLSLEIQRRNQNQHWGHVRIGWRASSMKIEPRDASITGELHNHLIQTVDIPDVSDMLGRCHNNRDLGFLLAAYYFALAPADFKTKFYNAFTIIEHIEKRYRDRINSTLLLSESQIKNLLGVVNAALKFIEDVKVRKRVYSDISGTVKGTTQENREEKLYRILWDVFNVRTINYYANQVEVNIDLLKRFIKTRNSLFHGSGVAASPSSVDEELKRDTDLLILLCESILTVMICETSY